jgi:hypothetical protein
MIGGILGIISHSCCLDGDLVNVFDYLLIGYIIRSVICYHYDENSYEK